MALMETHSSQFQSRVSRLLCGIICFLPSLLLAHPGHYHPDETDEFDFLRATFLHTHGALEISLACLAIAALVVLWFHKNPVVRVGALAAGFVSVVMIAIQ